ncbi:MAG: hypothetical protein ACQXXF_02735 [Thermoplasmatota archaeon]
MKHKILLSLIMISILSINILAIGQPVSTDFKNVKTTNFDDPAPIWNVGNSWTYTIDNFVVNYRYYDLKIYMIGRIDDLKWTVVDTSGSDYVVSLTGKITADSYEINLPFGSRIIRITGSVKPLLTRLSGTIVFTKSDLEVKDVSANLKGIVPAKISPIPISFPLPFKVTMDGDLSTVFPLFDFPLYGNKFWSLPSITITSNLKIGGLLGLIKYPISFRTSYSWTPFAFFCKPKVDVTVEAGTFSAYNITSTLFNIFEYYYAPSVGNLVKIKAILTNGQVYGQLKSYNYP